MTSLRYIELRVIKTYAWSNAIANSRPVIASKNVQANGVINGNVINAINATIEFNPAVKIASISQIA